MEPGRYRRRPFPVGPAYARPVSDSRPSRVPPGDGSDLPTAVVTWATLLARWTALVKAGEGLVMAAPDDADARRWRASIPDIVTLQSVTFALGDLESVADVDRSIARDRADLAVTESCGRLDELWRGLEMPPALLEVASDARQAVQLAVYAGLQWVVNATAVPWRMPEIEPDLDRSMGTLALMQPGTLALPGSPVAWWTECKLPAGLRDEIESGQGTLEVRSGPPVQVYRQVDEQGRLVRDVVEGLDTLPVGMPLLVPICLDGEPIGRFTVEAGAWAKANDAALAGVDPLPVISEGDPRG